MRHIEIKIKMSRVETSDIPLFEEFKMLCHCRVRIEDSIVKNSEKIESMQNKNRDV